jgi:hypothetical protein
VVRKSVAYGLFVTHSDFYLLQCRARGAKIKSSGKRAGSWLVVSAENHVSLPTPKKAEPGQGK